MNLSRVLLNTSTFKFKYSLKESFRFFPLRILVFNDNLIFLIQTILTQNTYDVLKECPRKIVESKKNVGGRRSHFPVWYFVYNNNDIILQWANYFMI